MKVDTDDASPVVHDPGRRRHRRARGARAAELPGLPRRAHRAAQPGLDPRHARGGPARRPAAAARGSACCSSTSTTSSWSTTRSATPPATRSWRSSPTASPRCCAPRPRRPLRRRRVRRRGARRRRTAPGVEQVAERISNAIATELTVQGHRIVPTASIGIAVSTSTSTPASLLRDTDSALFRAKYAGRARWHFVRRGDARPGGRPAHPRGRAAPRAWRGTSSSCTTSRSCRLADGEVVGARGAGALAAPRAAGCCSPATSSRSPRTPASSSRSGGSCSTRSARSSPPTRTCPGAMSVNVSAVELSRPRVARARRGRRSRRHGVDPHRLVVEVTETAVLSLLDGTRSDLRRAARPRRRRPRRRLRHRLLVHLAAARPARHRASSSTAASCATSPRTTARRTRSQPASPGWRRACTWPASPRASRPRRRRRVLRRAGLDARAGLPVRPSGRRAARLLDRRRLALTAARDDPDGPRARRCRTCMIGDGSRGDVP